MLIQNDEILVIFQYLQAKYWQRFYNYRVLLQTAQATHKYLDVLKSKKTPYFFAFAVLRCCKKAKKSLLKLTEHSELDTKKTIKTRSFKLT